MSEAAPSDRKLEAIKIRREQRRATVREIWERMRDREGKLAYTTVLSLLRVMERKGLVGRELERLEQRIAAAKRRARRGGKGAAE